MAILPGESTSGETLGRDAYLDHCCVGPTDPDVANQSRPGYGQTRAVGANEAFKVDYQISMGTVIQETTKKTLFGNYHDTFYSKHRKLARDDTKERVNICAQSQFRVCHIMGMLREKRGEKRFDFCNDRMTHSK
mmetsp:Transcript_33510/g.33752  ORF Transcript_33510/g.33752 Transcript_33510/m.33752 type:complete len:134 (-) Transcript_33510:27-428(-)